MGAGDYDREITFLQRAAMPVGPVPASAPFPRREGYVFFTDGWGAWKESRPREINHLGFVRQARNGVLTWYGGGVAGPITTAHRVVVDGEEFEILSVKPEAPNGEVVADCQTAATPLSYLREFENRGEAIIVERVSPRKRIIVRGIVTGYEPNELVGGITQADRKVFLYPPDVDAHMPADRPLTAGDRVFVRDRLMTIAEVDNSSHRVAGVLNAYQLRVTG